MSYSDKDNIVFFDSECVLCGNFLKLLLKIDINKKLHFASLQSEFSKRMLPAEFVAASNYKTVAFKKNDEISFYSTAVVKIFSAIGFPWNIASITLIIPKKWRDRLYMKVSNNRYSWFGKSDQCIIPDQSLESRFVHPLNY